MTDLEQRIREAYDAQHASDELRGRYGCIIARRYDFGCDELCKLTI